MAIRENAALNVLSKHSKSIFLTLNGFYSEEQCNHVNVKVLDGGQVRLKINKINK